MFAPRNVSSLVPRYARVAAAVPLVALLVLAYIVSQAPLRGGEEPLQAAAPDTASVGTAGDRFVPTTIIDQIVAEPLPPTF